MDQPINRPRSGSVTVRLQIFSGTADPIWTCSDAEVDELTALIDGLTEVTNLKPPAVAGRLGYRGFIITAPSHDFAPETDVLVHAGIVDRQRFALNLVDEGNKIERFLLKTAPADKVDSPLRNRVNAAIHFTPPMTPRVGRRGRKRRKSSKAKAKTKKGKTGEACRPEYEPAKWNTAAHMGPNHCYDYATDVMTDLGAQPGEGGGKACCATSKDVNCPAITAAAKLDGLKSVASTTAPPDGHYVALVVQAAGTPDRDFHWYRRDCNGRWSHKVGNSPVTNKDNSDDLIDDPRTCDRGDYTVFCGFFSCDADKVKIGP